MTGSWWNTALPEQTFPSEGRQQDSPPGLSRQQLLHTTSLPQSRALGGRLRARWPSGKVALTSWKNQNGKRTASLCTSHCAPASAQGERAVYAAATLRGLAGFPRGCWDPGVAGTQGTDGKRI